MAKVILQQVPEHVQCQYDIQVTILTVWIQIILSIQEQQRFVMDWIMIVMVLLMTV